MSIHKCPPLILAKLHKAAHILRWRNDLRRYIRFMDLLYFTSQRKFCWIVNFDYITIGFENLIPHTGHGSNEIEIELPFQPLPHDIHVKHPQKTAPKAVPKRRGCFGLIGQ